MQTFVLAAEAKGIALGTDLSDRCAAVTGEVRLIERVLDNLLDNAIRFTPKGGAVSVACARDGDVVRVRVTDTGPGIATEDIDKIFDRFYRGRQPADTSTNAGLGLSIARRIMALHGGELTASHQRGGGSEFAFWLPQSSTSTPS